MRIVRMHECHAVPWKNGQGETREILRHPEGGGPFTWRLSVADVVQSGPFSEFAGYERIITLLEGDGFVLRFADGREHALTDPHVPYAFDGAAPVSCVLQGGGSKDLNLMVRRNTLRATRGVTGVAGEHVFAPAAAATRLIVCLGQALRIRLGDEPAVDLARWDTAMIAPREAEDRPLRCQAGKPSKIFHADIAAPDSL